MSVTGTRVQESRLPSVLDLATVEESNEGLTLETYIPEKMFDMIAKGEVVEPYARQFAR